MFGIFGAGVSARHAACAAVSSIAARRTHIGDIGALSTVIAVPLAVSARWLSRANRCLQGAVGAISIAIGATTIYATAFA